MRDSLRFLGRHCLSFLFVIAVLLVATAGNAFAGLQDDDGPPAWATPSICANGNCGLTTTATTFGLGAGRTYQLGSFGLSMQTSVQLPRPLPLARRVLGAPFRLVRNVLGR